MGEWYWDPETQETKQKQKYDYFHDSGTEWIKNKAIHWSGSLVLDPSNPEKILVTSGNGVFTWSDIWSEDPYAEFTATGIEEVVALDLCSVEGGYVYSSIGDYDGFVHTDTKTSSQHTPNMGSCSSISYCLQDPKMMMRTSENFGDTQYSKDGGKTWIKMSGSAPSGGDSAIIKLKDGTYRFFHGSRDGNSISYSDDFGATWTAASGIKGSKKCIIEVDAENPQYVYAYNNETQYSEQKTYYYLNVSTDYGKTFTPKQVAVNDMCADFRRPAAVPDDSGTVFCPVGWYGMYVTHDYGETFEKVESVYYCETVGYGAAKDKNSPLTLYMWGRLDENSQNGIYASTDSGKSWFRINDDLHSYGGTGNGNFVVGDMNEYGTVYMSTVGVGIVYGKTGGSSIIDPPVETVLWGDANCDGKVNVQDVAMAAKKAINQLSASQITEQGLKNIDCKADGKINVQDVAIIAKLAINLLKQSDMPM